MTLWGCLVTCHRVIEINARECPSHHPNPKRNVKCAWGNRDNKFDDTWTGIRGGKGCVSWVSAKICFTGVKLTNDFMLHYVDCTCVGVEGWMFASVFACVVCVTQHSQPLLRITHKTKLSFFLCFCLTQTAHSKRCVNVPFWTQTMVSVTALDGMI